MAHIIILDRTEALSRRVPELLHLIHEVIDFMEANGIQNPPQCVADLESEIDASNAAISGKIGDVEDWMKNHG